MIQIQSVKLVEGTDYDSWVQVFESQEAIKMRADAGLKILAYGWKAEKIRDTGDLSVLLVFREEM